MVLFTSGHVSCFCPCVIMKLVITTKELSPYKEEDGKIKGEDIFKDFFLLLGRGSGTNLPFNCRPEGA